MSSHYIFLSLLRFDPTQSSPAQMSDMGPSPGGAQAKGARPDENRSNNPESQPEPTPQRESIYIQGQADRDQGPHLRCGQNPGWKRFVRQDHPRDCGICQSNHQRWWRINNGDGSGHPRLPATG